MDLSSGLKEFSWLGFFPPARCPVYLPGQLSGYLRIR